MYMHILAAVAIGANTMLYKQNRDLEKHNAALKMALEKRTAGEVVIGFDTNKQRLSVGETDF